MDLSVVQDKNDSDEMLKETIRGVYQLWRCGRAPAKADKNGGNENGNSIEGEVFLNLVREAVVDGYVKRS